MSDTDRKIDEMFGMLHEIKPMISHMHESQKEIELRMRVLEARGEQHQVKIERLQSDFGGICRKFSNLAIAGQPARVQETKSWWLSVIEFLSVAPTYWHFVTLGFVLIGSVLINLWRLQK